MKIVRKSNGDVVFTDMRGKEHRLKNPSDDELTSWLTPLVVRQIVLEPHDPRDDIPVAEIKEASITDFMDSVADALSGDLELQPLPRDTGFFKLWPRK